MLFDYLLKCLSDITFINVINRLLCETIVYSLNALLRIRIKGLTLFIENMSENMWIIGGTLRNVDSK